MKKFLKIFGLVVLLLAIAVSALAAWQWKYVSALIEGMRYGETAIGEKKVEEVEKTVSEVNDYFSVDIRELTPEEEEKIANGELSQTAILAQIISDATGVPLSDESENPGPTVENEPEQPSEDSSEEQTAPSDNKGSESSEQNESTNEQTQTQPAETQPAAQSADVIVANSVNKLYNLQSSYNARLTALIGRAKAYYDQQKAANGKAAARASVMAKFSGELSSMESSCDASVEAVLSDLTSQLNAIGADTSIVSTLRSAYNSEKSAQRAAYVSKYMK